MISPIWRKYLRSIYNKESTFTCSKRTRDLDSKGIKDTGSNRTRILEQTEQASKNVV